MDHKVNPPVDEPRKPAIRMELVMVAAAEYLRMPNHNGIRLKQLAAKELITLVAT